MGCFGLSVSAPHGLLCCTLLSGQFLHGSVRYFVTERDILVITQHKLAGNVALEAALASGVCCK